ncbi:hypothetical protein A7K91_05875 [Paenibacillus oryzae]|jgi:HAD superfamily phosphatase (TIGR01668 family)|uniref:HAD family hydrolase n=1 Tax=Paenibacillus oryzae TaxID=1844972 RepID=A0A1A5YHR0_9BACL|nr:YqeG family HAD IIIA-type phosphatase [Paenibacillus oryzae]OBR65083.1 hypothetical protein A7K91_05875 [Paenibacillus oryzae]
MFERLVPKKRVHSVYDIDLDELYLHGVRGIITDLDNTLVGAREPLATPELIVWLDKVKAAGFRVVIVSNNNKTRVGNFAVPLDIPFLHAARKPSQQAFRKALALLQLEPGQTAMIGDQMMTDVLGGNRLGLHTILVAPISPADEGMMTRVNRKIEKYALTRLRRRGLWYEEDKQS